ncbi:alpha-D-ribose 1-methylphosphonate 5-triphosphate diphosphatase [Desulfocurvus sp. DL9XJH121]
MNELILTNARIVTRDEEFHGTLCASDGLVRSVDQGQSSLPEAVDFGGDYLIPGLIEMHTDNLERQLVPRPAVLWPSPLSALMAHDTQVVGAGITTVLDSVCCGEMNAGKMRRKIFGPSLEAVRKGRDKGLLRADHMLHLRCEICDPEVLTHFEPVADEPGLRLASLMDHTPGQRQFSSHEKYREYYGYTDWSDDKYQALVQRMRETQERLAPGNRARILELCKERGIPLASHDDTVPEHVDMAADDGVVISEFPTTEAAARRGRERGLAIVMGAPNVVRGGSHSGNVSALDMAREGLLDILSSDYVPASLLQAAFALHQTLGETLGQALSRVTSAPARALGLDDRGEIAPGKRADLVRVRLVDDQPVVMSVWKCAEKLY